MLQIRGTVQILNFSRVITKLNQHTQQNQYKNQNFITLKVMNQEIYSFLIIHRTIYTQMNIEIKPKLCLPYQWMTAAKKT